MASAFKCDRCGTYYGEETEPKTFRVQYLSPAVKDLQRWWYLDLCPICQEKLEKFIKMEG